MDDLAICKRIAEIDSVEVVERKHFDNLVFLKRDNNKIYNPLTDDSLCFKLMIKYKLDISLYHENTPKVFYSLG